MENITMEFNHVCEDTAHHLMKSTFRLAPVPGLSESLWLIYH